MIRTSFIKYSFGYSLIEILIVVVIISFLSVLGLVSYHNYNQAKILDIKTDQFISDLESAKKSAFSNQRQLCSSLNSYKLTINPPNQYAVIEVCQDLSLGKTVNYNFSESSLIFEEYSQQEEFFYPILLTATENCLIIKHTKLDKCKQINVNQVGTINVIDSSNCICP